MAADRRHDKVEARRTWPDGSERRAMRQSEELGERLRERAAKAMKAETEPMVNRYEVAFFEVSEEPRST